MPDVTTREATAADRDRVVALWHDCGLTRPWNDPVADFDRAVDGPTSAVLVRETAGDVVDVVASAMVGYDGHRGWVNYLAVHPNLRRQGLASQLMTHLEAELTAAGCPKLSLQIREGNEAVVGFYQALGYAVDPVVSMGKRLIAD